MTTNIDDRTGRGKLSRFLVYGALVLLAVFVVALLMAPDLDVNMRQRRNQASAVSAVLAINSLQRQYAEQHPNSGYSCQLSLLASAVHAPSGWSTGPAFLLGEQSHYKFSLVDCQPDAKGIVSNYKVTAVPVSRTEDGFSYAAYCSDKSEKIRYDADGSGEGCLLRGTELPAH